MMTPSTITPELVPATRSDLTFGKKVVLKDGDMCLGGCFLDFNPFNSREVRLGYPNEVYHEVATPLPEYVSIDKLFVEKPEESGLLEEGEVQEYSPLLSDSDAFELEDLIYLFPIFKQRIDTAIDNIDSPRAQYIPWRNLSMNVSGLMERVLPMLKKLETLSPRKEDGSGQDKERSNLQAEGPIE